MTPKQLNTNSIWTNRGKEIFMSEGIKTEIYPVKDIARAKAFYSGLLAVEPTMDEAYYVGFLSGIKKLVSIPMVTVRE